MYRGFVRVTAPGLPTWPRLLFHATKKQAVVSARLATWRSHEMAIGLTKLLSWSLSVWVVFWLWTRLPIGPDIIVRFISTMIGYGIFSHLSKFLLWGSLQPFLARQIFAYRTTAWFTTEAIGFQSRLYDGGVVQWREWNGEPVQSRFDVTNDPSADHAREGRSGRSGSSRHLHMAQILRLIIQTTNLNRVVTLSNQPDLVRSIPMLEIDQRDASNFTVVLAAAASLTAECDSHQATGVDIDAEAF